MKPSTRLTSFFDEDRIRSFFDACKSGDLDAVKCYHQQHGLPDLNQRDANNPEAGYAIAYAAARGHLEVVRYLFEASNQAIHLRQVGNASLYRAAQSKQMDVLRYLIEDATNPVTSRPKDPRKLSLKLDLTAHGQTLIRLASESLEMLRYFLESPYCQPPNIRAAVDILYSDAEILQIIDRRTAYRRPMLQYLLEDAPLPVRQSLARIIPWSFDGRFSEEVLTSSGVAFYGLDRLNFQSDADFKTACQHVGRVVTDSTLRCLKTLQIPSSEQRQYLISPAVRAVCDSGIVPTLAELERLLSAAGPDSKKRLGRL